jgi:hypothetical protein
MLMNAGRDGGKRVLRARPKDQQQARRICRSCYNEAVKAEQAAIGKIPMRRTQRKITTVKKTKYTIRIVIPGGRLHRQEAVACIIFSCGRPA